MAATPTSGWHGGGLVDQRFEIGMDLVTRRRRMKPVHKIAHDTLVPRIFEHPSAVNHGVQVLVPSHVDMLVGSQIQRR